MKRIFSITLLLFTIFVSNGLYSQDYDKYGGRSDLKIDNGTGVFRLGKIGDKHFLVTPEGNAFRSIGLNHSHTLTSSDYDEITADMKSMGFNSGDYQGPSWQWNRIPYSKGFSLLPNRTYEAESEFGFRDVFDPVFLSSLENKIKTTVEPHKNNANLICFFLTDTPVWESEKYGKSWLTFFKALDENSPGGKVWKQWKADNSGLDENEFIRVIARQLYEKATSYIRKYDNNHLIFTERYLEYIFPPRALEEALPFVDGIAIQPKNFLSFEFFDDVYEKYKKPIFVADHVTSFATDEYPNTMGQVADNEEDYLEYYKWSVQTVMARPYMVGYNKCQYQDAVAGSQLKQGLYRANGEPYEYTDSLYNIHTTALKSAYNVSIDNSSQGYNMDQYGGSRDKQFDDGEGKGFFRTKKEDGQWWLVTPEDNAFLSFGLNHFHSNLWAKEWNQSHWEQEFGGSAYSETWRDGLYNYAQEIMDSINANSFGYHNEDETLLDRPKKYPYIRQFMPLELSQHLNPTAEDFVDIFDDDFRQTCADAAFEQVAPYVSDPMIIGFAMADIPTLTEGHAESLENNLGYEIPTWPRVLRNLSASAKGKQKYVECMKTQYNENIANFNQTYNTQFSSWDDLLNAENWRTETDSNNAKELADNNEFGKLCINKYYEVSSMVFRAIDKNHLFLGDKINANLYNPDELKMVVNEIKDYVDVVLIQCFGKSDYQEQNHARISEVADLPVINGDGGFGAYGDPKMPNPQYPAAKDQAERAEWMLEYAENAFANPNFVGWHLCGVIDSWNTTGTQKPGIVNPLGEEHTEVIDALATIGNKLYEYRGIIPGSGGESGDDGLMDWGPYESVKQEAIQRIEKYRKGDVHLKVILPNQDVAANTEVTIDLKRHDFKWGAVVAKSFVNSPYSDIYKETFLKYFNASGFNIALKPKHRGTQTEEIAATQTMPWFLENDIYVRGHALTWEGENYMRPEDKSILNDASLTSQEKGEMLLESLGKHFYHAIPKWDVKCWDVTNEPIANNAVNNLFPDFDTHAYWFKLADSVRRANNKEDVLLFENDYQIISAISSWALNRPARYREIIDRHIALGAPVEGIGFQSRIKQGLITPDTIYNRLCDFDRYKLPYQATEFEIRDDQSKYVYTDEERKLITEYMMIMYFSHPKVKGFWHWTFADQNPNNPLDYPLFNYNGTPKVNGQKWMDLMDGFLNTHKVLTTSSTGEVDLRGYYGIYDIEAEIDGNMCIGTFEIDSSNTSPVIMVYLEGDTTTSSQEIKNSKPDDVQIRHNINQKYVEVHINSELLANNLELIFYDIQGRKIYEDFLVDSYTRISMDKIKRKGFSIAVARDKTTGRRLAIEKIILM